jgi:hypothetical protein
VFAAWSYFGKLSFGRRAETTMNFGTVARIVLRIPLAMQGLGFRSKPI